MLFEYSALPSETIAAVLPRGTTVKAGRASDKKQVANDALSLVSGFIRVQIVYPEESMLERAAKGRAQISTCWLSQF